MSVQLFLLSGGRKLGNRGFHLRVSFDSFVSRAIGSVVASEPYLVRHTLSPSAHLDNLGDDATLPRSRFTRLTGGIFCLPAQQLRTQGPHWGPKIFHFCTFVQLHILMGLTRCNLYLGSFLLRDPNGGKSSGCRCPSQTQSPPGQNRARCRQKAEVLCLQTVRGATYAPAV